MAPIGRIAAIRGLSGVGVWVLRRQPACGRTAARRYIGGVDASGILDGVVVSCLSLVWKNGHAFQEGMVEDGRAAEPRMRRKRFGTRVLHRF